jgi:hypothetical protein
MVSVVNSRAASPQRSTTSTVADSIAKAVAGLHKLALARMPPQIPEYCLINWIMTNSNYVYLCRWFRVSESSPKCPKGDSQEERIDEEQINPDISSLHEHEPFPKGISNPTPRSTQQRPRPFASGDSQD